MSVDVGAVCDALYDLNDPSDYAAIANLAERAEAALAEAEVVVDSLENALAACDGSPRLARWLFAERLSRQHPLFTDAVRHRLLKWAVSTGFSPTSTNWGDFESILQALKLTFGTPLVNLILLQLNPPAKSEKDAAPSSGNDASKALVTHTHQVRQIGAFVTKQANTQRTGADKTALQVRTIDSHAAMTMASSYAPLRPVEIQVALATPDADAPQGYMQAVPEELKKEYEETRRKRFRDIMERNRHFDEREEARGDDGQTGKPLVKVAVDYSDIVIPEDLPRDEYGVKRGNFPKGVRFIQRAIQQCGGCLELDILVQRLSTLSDREAVAEFGDVREFILLHRPSFKVEEEGGRWVVRLATEKASPPTDTMCPFCTRKLLSRNLARHQHSRRCVTAQLALGLAGQTKGPISLLASMAKHIIANPLEFDDDDVSFFTSCLEQSAATPRFKLSSPVQFAPIMKAIRVVRGRWLQRKRASSMGELVVDAHDGPMVHLFATLGRNVRRLPVPWIEMGDIVDMCKRFSPDLLPPHNPPPRPADPRINLENKFAGFLMCESEEDTDDAASQDEEVFSDEEGESFVFAPPVTLAESLMAAGFARDTKKLTYRMRTAPPMVLTRILKSERQTVQQMYASASSEKALVAPSQLPGALAPQQQQDVVMSLSGDNRANSRTYTF
jgi:hypothetical protein